MFVEIWIFFIQVFTILYRYGFHRFCTVCSYNPNHTEWHNYFVNIGKEDRHSPRMQLPRFSRGHFVGIHRHISTRLDLAVEGHKDVLVECLQYSLGITQFSGRGANSKFK